MTNIHALLFQADLDSTIANSDRIHVERQAWRRQTFAGVEAELVAVEGACQDAVPHVSSVERPPAMRTVVRHARHLLAISINEEVLSALQTRQHTAVRNLFQRAEVLPFLSRRG